MIGLDCLHQNGLVHKNFSLENIIIDKEGKVKLTNYWVTNDADMSVTNATFKKYTNPELIGIFEVTMLTNWWALGIIAYIMIFPEALFIYEIPEQIYKSLMTKTLENDEFMDALDFAKNLATQNCEEGLGKNGISDIKLHPFFKGISW